MVLRMAARMATHLHRLAAMQGMTTDELIEDSLWKFLRDRPWKAGLKMAAPSDFADLVAVRVVLSRVAMATLAARADELCETKEFVLYNAARYLALVVSPPPIKEPALFCH